MHKIIIIILGVIFCNNLSLTAQEVIVVPSDSFYISHKPSLSNENSIIIDGRTSNMFASGHIENAINIDADAENALELLKEKVLTPCVIVYCTTIRRSTDIVRLLSTFYTGKVIVISDGIRGWNNNNLPIVTTSPEK